MEILACEDEPVQKELLVRLFARSGVAAVVVSSGEEGIRRIAERHFDAVFLDIGLPGKSGLQVLHTLRENAATSDIPVVMLTADKTKETLLECKRLRVTDYLAKPFSIEQFEAKIDKLRKLIEERNARSNKTGLARVAVDFKPGILRVGFSGAVNAESLARFRFHLSQLGNKLKSSDAVFLDIAALPAFSAGQRKVLTDIASLSAPERTYILAGDAAYQLQEQIPEIAHRIVATEKEALKTIEEKAGEEFGPA